MRSFALVLAAVAFASMAPQPSSAAALSASIASKPATSLVGGVTFYRRHHDYDYYPRYRYSEYRYYPRHRYYYDDDIYYPRLLYFPYEYHYRPYRHYYYRRDRY